MKSCGTLEIVFSCTQHLEVTRLPKEEVRKFEWCLYNVDAYVCNLEIKLKWNELLCSREIVNRHFESKECFSAASCKVLCEFLTEAKISNFGHVWLPLNTWCLFTVEELMRISINGVVSPEHWQDQNKRTDELGSQIWENLCSLYSNKCLRLPSEKSVLASGSNLSLATELASWKVCLEPWNCF